MKVLKSNQNNRKYFQINPRISPLPSNTLWYVEEKSPAQEMYRALGAWGFILPAKRWRAIARAVRELKKYGFVIIPTVKAEKLTEDEAWIRKGFMSGLFDEEDLVKFYEAYEIDEE